MAHQICFYLTYQRKCFLLHTQHVCFIITIHISVTVLKALEKVFARVGNYWKTPRVVNNEEAPKVQEYEQGEIIFHLTFVDSTC